MGTTVFPSVNDAATVAGNGITLKESSLIAWLKALVYRNFVFSGLTLPASSGSLSLSVAAGEANIKGWRVAIDAPVAATCTASATNYIFLTVAVDGGGNAILTGTGFVVNTTGIAPANSVAIGTAITSGTAVTSTADTRVLAPFDWSQFPYPANLSGQLVLSNGQSADDVAIMALVNE